MKKADTTAELARKQLAAQAKARVVAGFVWPAPPYFEFTDPAAGRDGADCLLIFRDGNKASGELLAFLPDDATLKFRNRDATEGVNVAFSALLGVQLLHPIELRRQALPLDDTAELFAATERQPFLLQLVNGRTFKGETVGCVHALCGLFLYPPEGENAVTRWFVPADATNSSNVGKPIGEMLVEQNLASPEALLPSRKMSRHSTPSRPAAGSVNSKYGGAGQTNPATTRAFACALSCLRASSAVVSAFFTRTIFRNRALRAPPRGRPAGRRTRGSPPAPGGFPPASA